MVRESKKWTFLLNESSPFVGERVLTPFYITKILNLCDTAQVYLKQDADNKRRYDRFIAYHQSGWRMGSLCGIYRG